MQEYIFISLDIFKSILQNNGIRNRLEAWLTFLSVDEPEMIEKLIREYPQFKTYYEEIYELCRNTEKVMGMFSKELQELDRNTVQYMIDEMQDEIDAQRKLLSQKDNMIDNQQVKLDEQKDTINTQNKEIEELKRQLAQLQEETR